MDELGTRLVPWIQEEVAWARNRPHHERPSLPAPGDKVWLRRHEWEHDLRGAHHPAELATVLDVQPPGDMTDANLCQIVCNHDGTPILDAGIVRTAPVADPWPRLTVRGDTSGEQVECREARLRGSAGWLPLDYLDRAERWRLPGDTVLVARPPLPVLDRQPLGE